MATTTTTRFSTEVQQHLRTFMQYKDQLASSVQSSSSLTPEQIKRQLNCSDQEAESISALWPVYQAGHQEGSNSR